MKTSVFVWVFSKVVRSPKRLQSLRLRGSCILSRYSNKSTSAFIVSLRLLLFCWLHTSRIGECKMYVVSPKSFSRLFCCKFYRHAPKNGATRRTHTSHSIFICLRKVWILASLMWLLCKTETTKHTKLLKTHRYIERPAHKNRSWNMRAQRHLINRVLKHEPNGNPDDTNSLYVFSE